MDDLDDLETPDEAVDGGTSTQRGVHDIEGLARMGLRLDRGSKGPGRNIVRIFDEQRALVREEMDAGTHLADRTE
jgi:hypothetical protein